MADEDSSVDTSGAVKSRKNSEPSLEEIVEVFLERARGIVPPEFLTHVRNARKECYLAARSLLDARIQGLSEAEERQSNRKATRIKVE